MRISTFLYTLRQGAKNIWKNKMFSLASIATMSACIFLFGVFYSVVVNFQSVVKEVESGVAVTVFFVDGATQEQIDEVGAQISTPHLAFLVMMFLCIRFRQGQVRVRMIKPLV